MADAKYPDALGLLREALVLIEALSAGLKDRDAHFLATAGRDFIARVCETHDVVVSTEDSDAVS